jgi:hypothetical protein
MIRGVYPSTNGVPKIYINENDINTTCTNTKCKPYEYGNKKQATEF